MAKRALLAVAMANASTRTERAVGLQEFRGRAAPFAQTTTLENYAVMSCAQTEEAGVGECGECAEVWCTSEIECASMRRPVVRMANHCVDCEWGGLILSRDVFQQLAGLSGSSFSVRWRCVECDPSNEDFVGVDLRTALQALCFTVADNSDDDRAAANIVGSASGSGIYPGGKISFSNLDNSTFSDEGISDNSSSSVSNSTAGSIDTELWNEHDEETVTSSPSVSTPLPSPMPSSASDNSWSSPSSFPASASTATTPDNSSVDESPSLTPPTYPPSIADSQVPISSTSDSSSTGTTSDENNEQGKASVRRDSHASSGSTSGGKPMGKVPASTTPPTSLTQHSDSIDKSSSDGSFSSTSSVLKSPFFYASIVLAIVGLIGIVVVHKAKHKRRHQMEWMIYQASTRTATPASTSRPAPTSPRSIDVQLRIDNHDFIML